MQMNYKISCLFDYTFHKPDVCMYFNRDSTASYKKGSSIEIVFGYIVVSMHEKVLLKMFNLC
jgi:hypothetical protein